VHGDVGLEVVAKRGRDEHQQPHGLEAALPANHIAPVLEIPQALEREPRLRLVGVVHPHEGPALARGTRRQMAPFHHHDALDARPGQMEGRTEAIDACTHHDNI
jgi:hypothetical protein